MERPHCQTKFPARKLRIASSCRHLLQVHSAMSTFWAVDSLRHGLQRSVPRPCARHKNNSIRNKCDKSRKYCMHSCLNKKDIDEERQKEKVARIKNAKMT